MGRRIKGVLNTYMPYGIRDLVNTKIPYIMFSYSNILAGEIAYENICIESKQHIT